MRGLLIIVAFSLALSVPISGQDNTSKKAAPRPTNPAQVALKSLVGRHLYACNCNHNPLLMMIYRNAKSDAGNPIPDSDIKDYFVKGQKLTIVAVDVKNEQQGWFAVWVTLRNEENGAVAQYPVETKNKNVTPTYVYNHLTVEGEYEFSSHPLREVTIGSPERDAFCAYGTPQHMNDDVYMLQLVYDDYGKYIYIDNRTDKVVDIQTSY